MALHRNVYSIAGATANGTLDKESLDTEIKADGTVSPIYQYLTQEGLDR